MVMDQGGQTEAVRLVRSMKAEHTRCKTPDRDPILVARWHGTLDWHADSRIDSEFDQSPRPTLVTVTLGN